MLSSQLKCISFAIIYTEMCGWWNVKGVCARIWRKLPHRWMLSSQQFVLVYWECFFFFYSFKILFMENLSKKLFFFFIFFAHNKLYLASDLHIYDGTVLVLHDWISYREFFFLYVIYQTMIFYLKLIVLGKELIIVVWCSCYCWKLN